jgi:hypothetical protein
MLVPVIFLHGHNPIHTLSFFSFLNLKLTRVNLVLILQCRTMLNGSQMFHVTSLVSWHRMKPLYFTKNAYILCQETKLVTWNIWLPFSIVRHCKISTRFTLVNFKFRKLKKERVWIGLCPWRNITGTSIESESSYQTLVKNGGFW